MVPLTWMTFSSSLKCIYWTRSTWLCFFQSIGSDFTVSNMAGITRSRHMRIILILFGANFQQASKTSNDSYIHAYIHTPFIIQDKQRTSALVNNVKEYHEITISLRCYRSPIRATKAPTKMSNVFLSVQCKQLFCSRWNCCRYLANASD